MASSFQPCTMFKCNPLLFFLLKTLIIAEWSVRKIVGYSSTSSKSYSRVVTLLINSCRDDKNIWKWWQGYAWGAFLVKKTPDLLMLISTDLSSYSAVQQSCTPSSTCSFIFSAAVSHIHFSMIVPFKTPIARKGEAFRLWDFERWSANDWALHTEIDVVGESDVFCHQTWNFTKNIVNFTFNSR